jgi:hypothetical protein
MNRRTWVKRGLLALVGVVVAACGLDRAAGPKAAHVDVPPAKDDEMSFCYNCGHYKKNHDLKDDGSRGTCHGFGWDGDSGTCSYYYCSCSPWFCTAFVPYPSGGEGGGGHQQPPIPNSIGGSAL